MVTKEQAQNVRNFEHTIVESAIRAEKHPEVRRVLHLNSWKIKSWDDYSSWKKHARPWVSVAWRNKCRLNNEFVEIQES